MKGRVLDYSVQTNSGIISGDDGYRYTFTGPEWRESMTPVQGMYVDFVTEPGEGGVVEARSVYLAGSPAPPDFAGSSKSKVAAGVLGILLGVWGIHKFYLGYTAQGVIMLAATIAGFVLAIVIIGFFIMLAVGVIGLIEGIIYLTQSDEDFERIYVTGRKPWF